MIVAFAVFAADKPGIVKFDRELDGLRQKHGIPGLSAGIVRKQMLIWEKGYGMADVANQVTATPDTLYLVASLTKTFASILLMKCVEAGKLDLNDPITKYSNRISDPGVTVRHVFTHTSQSAPPGESYRYNGARFGALTAVVDSCAGKPFRVALAESILDPLKMADTLPGKDTGNPSPELAALFRPEALSRYKSISQRLAKPYKDGQPSAYPQEDISASAGLISTVRDLAKYDAAVDKHVLLKASTQEQAWKNAVSSKGQTLPYALGWFVQRYKGVRLVWHYGYWDTFSALIFKVPERQVTLLLLANSAGLSAPFPGLGAGDVTSSDFAKLFLEKIVDLRLSKS